MWTLPSLDFNMSIVANGNISKTKKKKKKKKKKNNNNNNNKGMANCVDTDEPSNLDFHCLQRHYENTPFIILTPLNHTFI